MDETAKTNEAGTDQALPTSGSLWRQRTDPETRVSIVGIVAGKIGAQGQRGLVVRYRYTGGAMLVSECSLDNFLYCFEPVEKVAAARHPDADWESLVAMLENHRRLACEAEDRRIQERDAARRWSAAWKAKAKELREAQQWSALDYVAPILLGALSALLIRDFIVQFFA